MEQKQEIAANYINDIRECIINLVTINRNNTAALIELSTLSRQVLALHEFMQDTFKVNGMLKNKLKGYEEEFNDLRSKIKDLLDGVEY